MLMVRNVLLTWQHLILDPPFIRGFWMHTFNLWIFYFKTFFFYLIYYGQWFNTWKALPYVLSEIVDKGGANAMPVEVAVCWVIPETLSAQNIVTSTVNLDHAHGGYRVPALSPLCPCLCLSSRPPCAFASALSPWCPPALTFHNKCP